MLSLLLSLALTQAAPVSAEALFQEARVEAAKRNFEKACALFAQSHELEPALGTLLNLADCYEQERKYASAWLRFNEGAEWAARNKESRRKHFAQARSEKLKPRLSYLVLKQEAPVPEQALWLNGKAVPSAQSQSIPVDGGTYELRASAPGYADFVTQVTVQPEKESQVVQIPALVRVMPPPTLPAESVAAAAPAPALTRTSNVPSRTMPIVMTASGAVLLAAGAAGLVYTYSGHERFSRQQDGGPDAASPTVSRAEFQTLKTLYPISWAAVGVGAAVLVGGMTWMKTQESEQSINVVPSAGPEGASVQVLGTF